MSINKAMDVIEIVKLLIEAIGPTVKEISRMHGIVHKRAAVEINGLKGFLVWDYIIYNEITFDDESGNIYSFYTSTSDDETEKEWDKLIQKYGI